MSNPTNNRFYRQAEVGIAPPDGMKQRPLAAARGEGPPVTQEAQVWMAPPAWKLPPNGKKDRLGMLCSKCGGDTGVVDTRAATNNTIRRRRVCFACGHRLTTFEAVADTNPGAESDALRKHAAELRDIAARIERILDKPES
jgi:hypothetical protein